MSLLKKITFLGFILSLTLLPTTTVLAQYGLQETARETGLTDERYPSDIPTLIGNVIGTALSMIAVIFFILMVYGGFLWMTAHGDSGQVDKAKDTIIAAVIGIIVVLASYAITNFVFKAVSGTEATPTPAAATTPANPPPDEADALACEEDADCEEFGNNFVCRANLCLLKE